jgi:hypothetical protein
MSEAKNKYVFVVCGARKHIDTLHFSLAALKQFTQLEIWVVTDASKNEIPVNHLHVLNIPTPTHLDNHQSVIYLKTGLHNFLPGGFTYCYLDTDVIALGNEADDIFNQKNGVISFAADHCTLRQFSPHAVNCGCAEKNKSDHDEIQNLLKKFGYNPPAIARNLLPKQQQLKRLLEIIKHHKGHFLMTALRYLFSPHVFKLGEDYFYHRAKNYWADKEGNPFLYDVPNAVIKQVEANSAWRWNRFKRRWINPEGKDIELLECGHLKEAIASKFNVTIDERWQHWNGGVFLFDDASHPFMDEWHKNTLAIFEDAHWKTRDQGALIATAWKLGLQPTPLLSKKFNFIAYFYNPALMISPDKRAISDNALAAKYQPVFIHVLNHFGDKEWDVWNWIDLKLKRYKT